MFHGEVRLDEELLVIGIEDSRVDVLAGEGLNGFPDAHLVEGRGLRPGTYPTLLIAIDPAKG